MTGKTHQIFGLSLGLTTFLLISEPSYNPATLAAVFIISSVGSLLPDADKATSQIWHSVPVVGHGAGKIVEPFISHRGITHSLIGMVLAGFLFFFVLKYFPSYWGINFLAVFICALIAYFSHVFADMFTVEGVPLLWPAKWKVGIPPKPLDGLRIMSGKWFENLVIFPILNILLIFLIWSNWTSIKLFLFK